MVFGRQFGHVVARVAPTLFGSDPDIVSGLNCQGSENLKFVDYDGAIP
jgi:hypothetical protein